MVEFSSRVAHKTPTSFSDDIYTPFEDMGMGAWSNEQIAEFFEGKTVLDVGSGFEGIARRLFQIFGHSPNAPRVVNLNPQFSDWRMHDEYINGKRQSGPRYKQYDLETNIREIMEISGEDADGYFAQRTAVAGLVQQLPFANESIDVVTSTWGFPRCLYDFHRDNKNHSAGYSEVVRVLVPGGVAVLSSIPSSVGVADFVNHASKILDEISNCASGFEYDINKVTEDYTIKITKLE